MTRESGVNRTHVVPVQDYCEGSSPRRRAFRISRIAKTILAMTIASVSHRSQSRMYLLSCTPHLRRELKLGGLAAAFVHFGVGDRGILFCTSVTTLHFPRTCVPRGIPRPLWIRGCQTPARQSGYAANEETSAVPKVSQRRQGAGDSLGNADF